MSLVGLTMATFLEFTYNCFYHLNQYFRTFWPVKHLFGRQLRPPSNDTELVILRVIYLIKHQQDNDENLVTKLIHTLPADEDVFCIQDQNTGYNLLQLAVIYNRKDLILLILARFCQKLDIDCSPPVHLAAFLGYHRILENLLEHNAGGSSDLCGMCYPDPHIPTEYHRWLGVFDYPVYKCKFNAQLPIYSAISQDNIECVKLLLQHMSQSHGGVFPSPPSLLHYSCQRGAENCIQYFVSKYPEEVNSVDWTTKDTPLLAAVVWGSKCARILIENGANVKTVSKSGETALHRLYRNDIDGLFSIYDTTKYLLTTGIEQLVNCENNNEETPLHVLVTHVSYIGGDLLHPDQGQGHIPRSQLQPDYQDQVVNSLDALLKFNADPHAQNRYGLQPLNKLMHIALKSCCPEEEKTSCIAMSISSRYIYKNDFKHLKKSIEVLLQHDSDPNAQCDIGHTPFILLLQCLMYMEIEELVFQQMDIVDTLDILLKHGANPNFLTSDEATCSTFIAKIASRYFQNDSDTGMIDESTQGFADLINKVLEVLLKYGLNPNHVSHKRMRQLKGGTGNALVEFVSLTSLANSTLDFMVVHKWLKTLFQWGADPDLEPYPSEPVICHSQSSIFLKKQGTQAMSHYIHRLNGLDSIFQDGNAEELLLLFYNTMSHKILYDCLNTVKFMSRFNPYSSTNREFNNVLNNLSENPRSLKQITRVCIYNAVDRKLGAAVPRLPLPTPMKKYLLEIE